MKKISSIVLILAMLLNLGGFSAFAEETPSETAGATVNGVSTKDELDEAITNAADGDTIFLTADINYGSDQLKINKAITLDLNGNTLTISNNWGGMSVKNNPTIKNGTIKHTGNTAAIKVWNATAFEDLTVEVTSYTDGKVKGGIVLQSGSTTRVDSIKNVTIKGEGLTNGIETYNCGDATKDVIGSMENVTIDANGTGMLISAPCGIAKDCSIKGGTTGIELALKGTYNAMIDLENCNVEGGTQALYVHDEGKEYVYEGKIKITADDSSKFSSNGTILTYAVADEEDVELSSNIGAYAHKDVAEADGVKYKTIAEAIAKATSKVIIYAGDYTENINVNKAITVEGETDTEGNNLVNISGKLDITKDNATVKNLNVKNGNATAGYIGAKDVVVEGCSIVGGNGFRYCYTSGLTTFKDSTITGATYGIHFDGSADGEIVIDNCIITGWTSFAGTITKVTINDSKFEKGNYNQLRLYQNSEITNTEFNPDMTVDFGKNEVQCIINDCTVTDGSSISNIIYLGDIATMGVKLTVDGIPVKIAASVANGEDIEYYLTLQDAVDAAAEGDEIVIINDFALDTSVKIANGKKIILNLNGKTITGTDNTETNFSLIDNHGELTVTGNGTMTLTATVNSGWNRYSAVLANNPGGNLIVENGIIEHLGGTDMAYGIDNLTNGKGTYAEAIINGGTIKSPYRAIRQFLNGVEADNILTVNGGTIDGANKSIWMQDPSKNANTGKLTVKKDAIINGDIYLTVTAGSTEWPVEVSIAAAALSGESTVATNNNIPEGYIVEEKDGIYGVRKVEEEATLRTKVMVIRNNNSLTSPSGANAYKVTLIASLHSLNYSRAGFEIKVSRSDKVYTYQTEVGYKSVKVTIGDETKIYQPTFLDENASHMYMVNVWLGASTFNAEDTIQVRPYVEHLDGTMEYGAWRTTGTIGKVN